MSKISKTAAAAMKAGQGVQTKVDHFGTNEKKIKELRNQRRDGLAVNRFDFIDALLEEYDKEQAAVVHLGASTAALLARAEAAEAQNKTDLFVLEEVSAARDIVVAELNALKREFETRENSTEVTSEGTSQS